MGFKHLIGFGVAGNFAGHLEQAGEANDFKYVEVKEVLQPKAIFPFYVPNHSTFLGQYPLSSDTITFPQDADNLQIEPEIALICEINYDQHHQVTALLPRQFAAYNDCSIRREGAKKIADKKNWGACSKGLANTFIPLNGFSAGSNIDDYRIACFHERNAEINAYGIDSPAIGYSYFHEKLLDWIIDRMNHQPDQDPMHNIAELLAQANYPQQVIISIGATRYTEFGETHFLQPGDKSIVVVYNGSKYSPEMIESMVREQKIEGDLSALIQTVMS